MITSILGPTIAKLLIAVVITILTWLAREAVEVVKNKAEAFLSANDRDALYSAVKVGVRVAQSYGITLDGTRALLETKGSEAASHYLERLGIKDVSPEYLLDLLHAEHQKAQSNTAHLGAAIGKIKIGEDITDEQLDAAVQRWFHGGQISTKTPRRV